MLAFARPEKHAVHDALTSVALNCLVWPPKSERLFRMLPGQNDLITETRLRLKRLGKRKNLRFDLGYADYINLLAKLADIGAERSVLNTEMILYANATSLAEKFLECR